MNVSPVRDAVLVFLAEFAKTGEPMLTTEEISRRTGLNGSSVSTAICCLRKHGNIIVELSTTDRRRRRVFVDGNWTGWSEPRTGVRYVGQIAQTRCDSIVDAEEKYIADWPACRIPDFSAQNIDVPDDIGTFSVPPTWVPRGEV